MSKAKEKYIPLYFRKAPPKTGYHAGLVHEVPESLAKTYVKKGYATEPTPVLPKDIPFRKELIAHGIETIGELEKMKDVKVVKGIGAAGEREIAEYLAK